MQTYELQFYNVAAVSKEKRFVGTISFEAKSNSEAIFEAPSLEFSHKMEGELALLFQGRQLICAIKYTRNALANFLKHA